MIDDNLSVDTKIVLESTMLHPDEEDISYEVYKRKIPSFSLAEFEKFYAKNIKPNSLLMSLKLSNNQEKIKRALQNESFNDELYLKIFKLYDWGEDGVYDSDENRDVTLSFIKRFFRVDHFLDPATIYSPITLAKIITESQNSELLDALLYMPNYEFKVSKNTTAPKNIRELVALNRYTSLQTLKKLLNYKDRQIDLFLALNPSLSKEMQKELYTRGDKSIKEALSQNENLDDELFFLLLDDETSDVLLSFAKINQERFEAAKGSRGFHFIAQNKSISEFADELFSLKSEKIDKLLAMNQAIDSILATKLYQRNKNLAPFLAKNPKISKELAQELYELKIEEVDRSLASNPSTPLTILEALYSRDEYELNKELALNESMPIELLQQLQLDSRLMNNLSKNRTFTDKLLNNLGI